MSTPTIDSDKQVLWFRLPKVLEDVHYPTVSLCKKETLRRMVSGLISNGYVYVCSRPTRRLWYLVSIYKRINLYVHIGDS